MTEAPTSQHLNSTVGNETKGATHPTVAEALPDRSEHLTLPATCTGLAVAVLAHVISLSPSSQNLFALIFTRDVHHLVVDIVSKSKANYVTFLSLADGSHLLRDFKHSLPLAHARRGLISLNVCDVRLRLHDRVITTDYDTVTKV